MIRPKNKIYDSAKRILCLAMVMEKRMGNSKKSNMRFGQKNLIFGSADGEGWETQTMKHKE
jgi:hypothetical protein